MPGEHEGTMAIADLYAKSLLLAAGELGRQEQIAEAFDDLVAYMDCDPNFAAFLTAASVDDDPRRESLEKLFRGKLDDLLLNLLQVLNNRGRMELIRSIQRCVVLRMEEQHHQQEVLVETAKPLTDALRAEIKAAVSDWIGKEALLIEEVRPELIGGVVIHIGDVQIDGSVASQIQAMRGRLRERATEEIYSGRGYEVES